MNKEVNTDDRYTRIGEIIGLLWQKQIQLRRAELNEVFTRDILDTIESYHTKSRNMEKHYKQTELAMEYITCFLDTQKATIQKFAKRLSTHELKITDIDMCIKNIENKMSRLEKKWEHIHNGFRRAANSFDGEDKIKHQNRISEFITKFAITSEDIYQTEYEFKILKGLVEKQIKS